MSRRARNPALRWNLLGLAVVAALVLALWPRESASPPVRVDGASPVPSEAAGTDAGAGADLRGPRAAADLLPCPTGVPGAVGTSGPLAGLVLECLGDGSPVDLGTALAGRPALLNVWTFWCPPCARELPAVQELAQQVGDRLTVLTVHSEVDPARALSTLADYGVRVPAVQDATGRVSALVGAPQVFPTTVLLAADGTVARVLAKEYTDPDEIAADVERYLGVRR